MGESECVIPDDPEAESKARDEYIRRNEEEYGILLDNSKIMSNAGMRMLSKLMANSIWAKFFYVLCNIVSFFIRWRLRNNLTKDLITVSWCYCLLLNI